MELGLDVTQATALAGRLADGGAALAHVEAVVRREIERAWWSGPAAERFRQQWSGSLGAHLRTAATLLQQQAAVVRKQRDEQIDASAANVAAPSSSPLAPPIAGLQTGTPVSEPAFGRPAAPVSWLGAGQIFGPDGPTVDDVVQGGFGDCTLMATLASLANRPKGRELLREMVHYDANRNKFYVEFRGINGASKANPWFVEVDGYANSANMVTGIGAVTIGESVGSKSPADWVQVYEHAYVEVRGESAFAGEGERVDAAFNRLFGSGAVEYFSTDRTNVQLWAQLIAASTSGSAITAGSLNGPLIYNLPRMESREQKWDREYRDAHGIVPGHAYSVLGVREEEGKQWVDMRNPWASGEPNPDVPFDERFGDGRFTIELDDFRRRFDGVAVVTLPE